MKIKNTIAFLLCIFLLFSFCIIPFDIASIFADDETQIIIKTKDELFQFSENCSVDTWSAGKKVMLAADIDLGNKEFKAIPTFSGSFDGQNHKITGLLIQKDGSYNGFFRYIAYGASVKNLTVSGKILPGGSKNHIGAIAGSNAGTIYNCYTSATVSGASYCGGICGINLSDGTVQASAASGIVRGQHYIGGICGQNLGMIINTTNNARVNTEADDSVKLDIKNIDIQNLNSTENLPQITDVGGISGYSAGVLQSCINNGEVGYKHIGYNIGGVAGRQGGYINSCTNNGTVYGRKDVGAIVGQMEPYILMKNNGETKGLLDSLNNELDRLQSVSDSVLNNTNGNIAGIFSNLRTISGYVNDAKGQIDIIRTKTTNIVNQDTDSVTNLSAKLSTSMNDMSNTLKKYGYIYSDTNNAVNNASENISSDLNNSIKKVNDIIDDFNKLVDKVSDTKEDAENIKSASRLLKDSFNSLSDAVENMNKAVLLIDKAINEFESVAGDKDDRDNAVNDLFDSLENLQGSIDGIQSAIDKIQINNQSLSDRLAQNGYLGIDGLKEYFSAQNAQFDAISTGISTLSQSVSAVKTNISSLKTILSDFDIGAAQSCYRKLSQAMQAMKNAFEDIQSSVSYLNKALDKIDIASADFTKAEKIDADKIISNLKDSTNSITGIINSVHSMTDELNGILDQLTEQPLLSLQRIDDEFIAAMDKLSDIISNITNTFSNLNTAAENTIDSAISGIKDINSQISGVTDAMTDLINGNFDIDKDFDIDKYIEDVSDSDNDAQTSGKVSECINYGEVHGDVNCGGIAGSMAIEYDFDPEDDIKSSSDSKKNIGFSTRAVIRRCTNNGAIESRDNCAGAIVGNENLGSVIKSNGLGSVTSTGGDYVGGIAGKSSSSIIACNAKCTLEGGDYIGGIAGFGNRISSACSVVRIKDADECMGAIAGKVDGNCKNNYFSSVDLHGIDSISYTGKAEPVSIDDIIAKSSNGTIFQTFNAIFNFESGETKIIKYQYGDSIPQNEIPKIPDKKGCYGVWDANSFENLTYDLNVSLNYKPYIPAVQIKNKRKSGLSIVVLEGLYTESTKVSAQLNPNLNTNLPHNAVEVWQIKATDSRKKQYKVHFLPAKNDTDPVIRVLKNGNWVKTSYKKDGQYLVFDASDSDVCFSVQKANVLWNIFAIVASIIGIAFVLLALLCLFRKKFRKIKTA